MRARITLKYHLASYNTAWAKESGHSDGAMQGEDKAEIGQKTQRCGNGVGDTSGMEMAEYRPVLPGAELVHNLMRTS